MGKHQIETIYLDPDIRKQLIKGILESVNRWTKEELIDYVKDNYSETLNTYDNIDIIGEAESLEIEL